MSLRDSVRHDLVLDRLPGRSRRSFLKVLTPPHDASSSATLFATLSRKTFGGSHTPTAVLFACFLSALAAHSRAQAIIGTISGSNQAILFPSPGAGLPAPIQVPISGIPPGAMPNAVAFFGTDGALVSDAHFHCVYVIRLSTRSVVSTIDTYPPYNGSSPTYDGSGTLVVSPDQQFALAQSAGPLTMAIISAPFGASSPITTVQLPGWNAGNEARGIAFDPAGRAFVYLNAEGFAGISVLEPPYTTVAFTMVVGTAPANAITLTPDGSRLLVTSGGSRVVKIFSAPYSAASIPVSLPMPGMTILDGIAATPDGEKVLVVSSTSARLLAIAAPFGPTSAIDEIPLNPAFGEFEDIDISADGRLAILTGGGLLGPPPEETPFVLAPFSAAAARVFSVRIPGGRGAGSVRIGRSGATGPGTRIPNVVPFRGASGPDP
jgi:DNA-binding beta-propeller fold protein YncE